MVGGDALDEAERWNRLHMERSTVGALRAQGCCGNAGILHQQTRGQ